MCRPVRRSRASKTHREPPLPRGRSGRYLLRTSPASSSARAALDMGLDSFAAGGVFPLWANARSTVWAPRPTTRLRAMSHHDDDEIAFDFFDEPETVEATQRRRLPRPAPQGGRGGGERPPRPPLRAPTGLVPLARLV